jgi:hypothetical protein
VLILCMLKDFPNLYVLQRTAKECRFIHTNDELRKVVIKVRILILFHIIFGKYFLITSSSSSFLSLTLIIIINIITS